ncbi:alpha/beta fold hydrolase [Halalkalicoccus jeotgali]|uniref:Alpha/beta hydrolase fold protein n=1 Tax=Halalkalicoccus jeotgali (strain DSM 18796 / CECT 7217 / JCM 14584 / KCTC 4019 / B3) TaxID=795797 RepID=D8JB00_HALJB|nr:alpha/beta hydrolase [Halalkalicoccus jeotgali]ADJ16453.1 alpha/beta hydrolase fold protein [Halalkalicoccus jeotgali B3]ELY41452.1 alpha/beta hydrolase fold protein [Halalkalicoccus jeotgali B3]
MADRSTEKILVRGRSVAFNQYGDPEGEPIVLFHGTPGSRCFGRLFEDVARRAGFQLLTPDRPRYGQSASWPKRTVTDTGAIVTGLLNTCESDNARIIGFSGGGPHALAAAATHPDRVREVHIISGATPRRLGEPAASQRRLAMLARQTPRLLRSLFRVQAWLADRSPTLVVSQYTAEPKEIPDTEAQLMARDFVEAVGKGGSGTVLEFQLLAEPWGFDLGEVDVPIQVWHGEHDANVPVGGVRDLYASCSDTELTVRDTDHLTTLLAYRDAIA